MLTTSYNALSTQTNKLINKIGFDIPQPGPARPMVDRSPFIPKILNELHIAAKSINRDLSKIKSAYYPLGGSDLWTLLVICPNIDKAVITGANPAGSLVLDKSNIEGVIRCANYNPPILSFTNNGEFTRIGGEFSDAQYPTILLMAAQMFISYGVRDFDIKKTEFGHSLNFVLNGILREVEYVSFCIGTRNAQEMNAEESTKRNYLANINADLLFHKAIPFKRAELSSPFSTIAVLTGAIGPEALVIADQEFETARDRNYMNPIEPTAIYSEITDNNRATVNISSYCGDYDFGYGHQIFLTQGSGLIPLNDPRRSPTQILRPKEEAEQYETRSLAKPFG